MFLLELTITKTIGSPNSKPRNARATGALRTAARI